MIRPFITGRGCPYNCSFCFNKAYSELYQGKGARTRRRSVDDVLAEIAEVRERYGLSFVLFYDDTFILSRRWLEEFASKYPTAIGLPWWAQARAELVTDDRVALLKKAGCVSMSFGLETGNDELRTAVLNRDMSKEQIIQAGEVLRAHGIAFSTNNMVGLPGGGLAADLETLELNITTKPDYANCFIYQPYPKTRLGELAREQGLIDSFDDLSGSVTDDTPLRFADDEKRQIENLQKLFSITVEFPWLLPLTMWAIRLPRLRLYWLIYKLWKGYALKQRIFRYRMPGREMFANLRSYMQISTQ
ncbi:MAG TPA: radical SAM protein [Anaerolineae bacterium]|nr:radical SAM protein [Anaerolineae bacterium]